MILLRKNVITCKSNGNWSDKENCPNGCENGACKEATTSTSSAPASTCSDTKCSLCNQAQCYQKSKCEWNDSLGRCTEDFPHHQRLLLLVQFHQHQLVLVLLPIVVIVLQFLTVLRLVVNGITVEITVLKR